jgi:NAD(P)-dependent dehydrogenase (short-subunit alcohol dehydrogenase family)
MQKMFNKKLKLSTIIISIGLVKFYSLGPKAVRKDMTEKIVLITGASDGIGVETSKELLKSNAKVIFACRNKEKTMNIINSLESKYKHNSYFIPLDLSDLNSVLEFKSKFSEKFDHIDILIHNAGMFDKKFILTKNGIEQTLQVNTIAPIILTQELLPLLTNSKSISKVINVSSNGHKRVELDLNEVKDQWINNSKNWNFYEKNYNPWKQYCYSKLGNVYFTHLFDEYIKKEKLPIRTYSLHPGVIFTGIARDTSNLFKIIAYLSYPISWIFMKNSFYGAQTTLHLCYEDVNDLKSGEYYQDCSIGKLHNQAQKSNDNRYIFSDWIKFTVKNSLSNYNLFILADKV